MNTKKAGFCVGFVIRSPCLVAYCSGWLAQIRKSYRQKTDQKHNKKPPALAQITHRTATTEQGRKCYTIADT